MKKKPETHQKSFKDLLDDPSIQELQQDKHHLVQPKKQKKQEIKRQQAASEIELSDAYHPNLPDEGPMRYSRDASSSVLKQLRRGDFTPEATLDLHGMTRPDAKRALISGLAEAVSQQLVCICVTHGHGQGILKQQVPFWLVQHPNVLAFHQAPQHYGGQATLLVLLDTLYDDQNKDKYDP